VATSLSEIKISCTVTPIYITTASTPHTHDRAWGLVQDNVALLVCERSCGMEEAPLGSTSSWNGRYLEIVLVRQVCPQHISNIDRYTSACSLE
jgi:hypothetical protein